MTPKTAGPAEGCRAPRRACLAVWPSAIGLALLFASSGCLGPRSLELTRLRYDQAVHETTEQQWLRNIVRLRYGDLPSFLDVSAITSQFEISSRGGVTAGQQRDSSNATGFGDWALQFRDAPTLSYTPRDPTELTRAMVAPVGITALGLIANNGWSFEDVLRLMVAEINGLENTPGAGLIIPETVPPLTPFPEMVRLSGILHRERAIALQSVDVPELVSPPIPADRVHGDDLVQAASNKLEYRPAAAPSSLVLTRPEPGYRLTFSRNAVGFPEATLLRELLRLDPGRSDYEVRRISVPSGAELQPLPDALDFVEVRTRTLLDMLTVLSKGVEVPEEHVCRGLAAQTPGPDGTLFDWTLTTRGLFHVCVSKKRPPEPNLAIEYEGYWYSIPASDKRSQATLSLIQALFNLQLSEPKKSGPLLTLPVGL